jgi:ABC-type multidrug transport system fused ATPase/permease subunit
VTTAAPLGANAASPAATAGPRLPPLFEAPRRRLLLVLVVLGLLQASLAAAAALGVRALFDALGSGSAVSSLLGQGPLVPVLALGGGAMLAALATIALRQWAGRLAESLGQQYVAAARLALLGHLFKLPPRHHQRMRHGHLMARLTGDLGALHRWAGRTLAPVLVGTASFVLLAATLAWMAPWVALGTLLVCLPLFGWAWRVSIRLERALRAERAQRWALAGQVGERLAAAAVVQANAQVGRELSRLRRRQQRLHDAAVLRAREAALLKALPPTVGTLMLGVLAGWGSWQVASGAWSSGALAGLLTLLGLVLSPLRDFAMGLGGWRNWRVSCEKLTSFLRNAPLPACAPQAEPPLPSGCLLRLDAVIVVPGSQAVTAELRQRDTLAVQGSSGSGKSALLEAVAGLLVPRAGRVLLDGVDAASVDLGSRGRRVALVAADLPLLRGSVAGNLRYRRKATAQEAMQRALVAAGVRALACGAALGLSDPVAEGGRNLPRVLRARLALARALVDMPALLLIDDFDELLDGDAAADAPLAALLREPPCSILIATRRPEWAARCAHRVALERVAVAVEPPRLELVHAS